MDGYVLGPPKYVGKMDNVWCVQCRNNQGYKSLECNVCGCQEFAFEKQSVRREWEIYRTMDHSQTEWVCEDCKQVTYNNEAPKKCIYCSCSTLRLLGTSQMLQNNIDPPQSRLEDIE